MLEKLIQKNFMKFFKNVNHFGIYVFKKLGEFDVGKFFK